MRTIIFFILFLFALGCEKSKQNIFVIDTFTNDTAFVITSKRTNNNTTLTLAVTGTSNDTTLLQGRIKIPPGLSINESIQLDFYGEEFVLNFSPHKATKGRIQIKYSVH
ncbi:hypothetical protein [Sediminibacterium sp.]|uniref:hypothetical protein n=1 Tax=Sediminibacterium sp. TaxID=1917865 RepID=UPI0025EF33E5|nr:hypothetical protein [Sediminibacterium sp.]MBW0177744.1 hypothetical protein [Sediminibacterium sp.]